MHNAKRRARALDASAQEALDVTFGRAVAAVEYILYAQCAA
jgi:hypothetical protein